MKKVVVFLLVLAAGYWFYNRLGGESDTPSFLVLALEFESQGRPMGLTIVEKLPPGVRCRDGLTTSFSEGIRERCGNCQVETRSCSEHLNGTHEAAFDNRVLDIPYFAYEKGGLLPQQDFRILFRGVDKAEAGGACVRIRKLLEDDLLFFLGGATECVRPSITR